MNRQEFSKIKTKDNSKVFFYSHFQHLYKPPPAGSLDTFSSPLSLISLSFLFSFSIILLYLRAHIKIYRPIISGQLLNFLRKWRRTGQMNK
ncbi:hypothetical protein FHS60_001251 [Alloprevotella rava]|uniref:Uncharacterized protein n=1 Tax=Alloprevotella rava TaxID=671218 RepID=A0A7W5UN97_9BACT|nr:hypothetical protein [Alloprevotella rava]